MHFTLAAALLFATPDDVEIAKGLQNLARMHAIAQVLAVRRNAGIESLADLPPDPWGTAYRITDSRIVSAGSDAEFEDEQLPSEQFDGTEGDAVLANGAMYRSNRNWLYEHAKNGEPLAALEELRSVELQYMMMRMPAMQTLTAAKLSADMMLRPGAKADAWRNPLRVEGNRIISAGADKVFDPASWDQPPKLDLREDIIVENGKVTRIVDAEEYLRKNPPYALPIAQPSDPPLFREKEVPYRPMSSKITPPVIVVRVEPQYPETYRRARISGIVILQTAISKNGTLDGMRLAKSCAPDLDTAAMEALRQWKFEPARVDGQPTDVYFNLTINFRLK